MIIVQSLQSKKRFLFIGTGYGEYESATPGAFLGNWSPDLNHGTSKMVCVCDKTGTLYWTQSKDVRVISINGTNISNLDIDNAE